MRSSIRVAGFAAVAMVAASLPGQVANADSPTTLYVRGGVTCSDTGPGSQADPFCTIQHAADVVNPGQTVLIDGTTATFTHVYDEAVTVTRSGTPEAPIVFTGTGPGGARAEILPGDGPAAVVTLTGVHDVRLEHLDIMHLPGQDGVDLQGVHGVTVDGFTIATVGGPVGPGGNGVTIDGSSSDVTVSRNGWENAVRFGTYGVQALSGASNITVTANSIWAEAGAVRLTGVSGAAVTSNGMTGKCGPMIGVDGTSSAVVVENNVVGPFPPTTNCATGTATALWVSADSATGVRADYNAVQIGAPDYVYDWAGTTYPTLQQFQAGTGQGAHDVPVPNYADGGGTPRGVPPEGSPLVDSADATAPGELGTDLSGRPHVDDPLVGNTGTGLGYHDRGAIELQDALPLAPVYTPSNTRGPAPLDLSVALDAPAVSPWAEPVTYTVDFGDGDGPVPVTAGTATHTYQTPGTYTATVAAADTGGSTSTVTQSVIVGTTLPNVPTLAVGPYTSDISGAGPSIGPALANFSVDKGGNDWEVTDDRLSFGDGTTAGAGGAQPVGHQFPGPGTYTATLTQTDVLGRVSTASTRATVGDEYFPVAGAPIRVADTRGQGKIPAHGTLTLSSQTMKVAWTGVDAVVLGVTVVNATTGGYISVYPHQSPSGTSNLNFAAGQVVANRVIVPPMPGGVDGMVDFYNGSNAPVDLLVDVYGFQTHGQFANTFGPHAPQRVLDTRHAVGAPQGPVPAFGSVTLPVAGSNGVPADATSVLLNVTTTDTQGAGYLTVYGHGSPRPTTSISNWKAGQTVANLVQVPVSDGQVVLYNGSNGTADFVADLVGYDNNYGLGSVFLPQMPPQRLLDTRAGATPTKLAPFHSIRVQVGGVFGLPAVGLSAAELNLTVTNTTNGGYLTAYPDGGSPAGTSSLNYSAGSTVANMAVPTVGADGAVDVYNGGPAAVDVVVDLYGAYYAYPSS